MDSDMENSKNLMKLASIVRFSILSAIILVLYSAQSFANPGSPLGQVKDTVESILNVMQNKNLSAPEHRAERRERIVDLIHVRFDFEEMSKRTLGREWKKRNNEEKKEFQKLFAELLEHTYIGRIEAYSDEKVEYAKEVFSPNSSDRARVYTKILKNGHEIPINYTLYKKGSEWFVYDVIIEGVSLVRNYRTEFGRILGKEDFAELIKRMREKIEINKENREG